MKRLFCLICTFAALLVFTGACSSNPEQPAPGSEPISTNGDVDHIDFKEVSMNGCEGKNSVVGVTITSSGTGTASFMISYPSKDESSSPGTVLAQERVDIASTETHIDLSVNAEFYSGGQVILNVEAGNYLVKPGEKGRQGAANAMMIPDVSNDNCRLNYERAEIVRLIVIALVVAVIIGAALTAAYNQVRRQSYNKST